MLSPKFSLSTRRLRLANIFLGGLLRREIGGESHGEKPDYSAVHPLKIGDVCRVVSACFRSVPLGFTEGSSEFATPCRNSLREKEWLEPESNRRHEDFQSSIFTLERDIRV